MPFEVGKLYTFKESEFEKSRESGKLVFKVRDPASATPYIIKPFEFQITDIPDKITCVYKGNDRLEQDMSTIVQELYEVGKEYRFRVMRQDNNASRNVSVRDDLRGLTFYPINLGKIKFERFQRITCKVVSTNDGKLRLELVQDEEKIQSKLSLTELLGLRGARSFGNKGLLDKLLQNPIFEEAREKFADNNPLWILVALEAITRSKHLWFPRGEGYRLGILRQVKELALSLIERSEYLNVFPLDDRRSLQGRLSAVILDCEDYLKAASLIVGGEDVSFITETLSSLKTTGWLYKPENKMRLLMALFTLKNSYVHDYIWEIFNIIRDHHADRRFLHEFAAGFILMLRIFIDNEANIVNTTNRDSLRALIEALAIELLLTRNKQFDRWNLYRGRLYTLTMHLVGNAGTVLFEKAFRALTENLDMPLEYSWKDLEDVNRLCHVNLNGFPAPRMEAEGKFISAFEARNGRLTVENGFMNVTPAQTGPATRRVIQFPLSADTAFSVDLNGRLDTRSAFDGTNLSEHHVMWRELEKCLFDVNQDVAVTATDVKRPARKLAPVIDDEVTFRIEGGEDGDIYTFRCVIEDPVFEGKGVINTRDIVLFPVKAYPDTFWTETGQQMLFRGRVIGSLPDGRVRLSMDREVDEEILRMARNDFNEDAQMEAVITKDNGGNCLAVTDGGYPVVIYKNGESLRQNDKVIVSIADVSWNKKSDRPYIIAKFESRVEDNDPVQNYMAVREALHFILGEVSGGAVWVPDPTVTAAEPEEAGDVSEVIPDVYLAAESVGGLSRLFDAMAFVTSDNLAGVYSLLSAARLLALLIGDNYRAQFLALKQEMVERLSGFAIDGLVAPAVVGELERKVEQFPGNDVDLYRRLEILKVLSALDKPSMGEAVMLPDETDSSTLGAIKRMVVSYNMLRGLKLNDVRRNLRRAIYGALNLTMPELDVSRVNASEDQHHEFKESLIYPAGNAMKADEKKQGLEIAQVICGMLNSEGGTLYIGVANSGVPRGLVNDFVYLNNGFEEFDLEDVKDKFSLKFGKILRDNFGLTVEGTQVYPTLVTLEFDDIDDNCFAVVTVRPYRGAVRMTDGQVFVRQDSSTLPVKKKAEQAELAAVRKELPL